MFNVFGRRKASTATAANPVLEIVGYIDAFKRDVETLIDRLPFEKPVDEPLPPWIMRIYPRHVPGIDRLDAHSPIFGEDYWYWRSGDGGTYHVRFMAFFRQLDLDRKTRYFRKYDLGPDWSERDEWCGELFKAGELEISEEDCDRLIDELLGHG